jgi:hypothetical protein
MKKRKHMPWFDEGYPELLERGKHTKLQWLQDSSEMNGNNLNNIKHEPNRYFRNKRSEYLKDKSN